MPAFSISSLQRNTAVLPPQPCPAFKPRPPARSTFRQSYDRGDFPISLKHDGRGNRISWKVPLESLDYHYYLPLFFDGLRETQHPYVFFAVQVVLSVSLAQLRTDLCLLCRALMTCWPEVGARKSCQSSLSSSFQSNVSLTEAPCLPGQCFTLPYLPVSLNTRKDSVMCRTLKALQKLVKSADYVGQALVPYYRFLSSNLQH